MPLRKALWHFGWCSNVPYWTLRVEQVMWWWRTGSVKQSSQYRGPHILTACVSGHFSSDCLPCDPMDWMSITGQGAVCVALEHIFQFSSIWKKHRLCTPRPQHKEDHLQNHTPDPYQHAFADFVYSFVYTLPYFPFSLPIPLTAICCF